MPIELRRWSIVLQKPLQIDMICEWNALKFTLYVRLAHLPFIEKLIHSVVSTCTHLHPNWNRTISVQCSRDRSQLSGTNKHSQNMSQMDWCVDRSSDMTQMNPQHPAVPKHQLGLLTGLIQAAGTSGVQNHTGGSRREARASWMWEKEGKRTVTSLMLHSPYTSDNMENVRGGESEMALEQTLTGPEVLTRENCQTEWNMMFSLCQRILRLLQSHLTNVAYLVLNSARDVD